MCYLEFYSVFFGFLGNFWENIPRLPFYYSVPLLECSTSVHCGSGYGLFEADTRYVFELNEWACKRLC